MKFIKAKLKLILAFFLIVFVLQINSAELVRIVHKTSGLCFTAESGIFPGGIRVLLHRCNNGENQKWNKKVTNHKHEFYLKESGDTKVIEVSGASDIIGAQIITSRSNGGDNQKWYFDQNKGTLKNVKSGKCIDVPAGNAFPGVNLQQFDCNGTNSQNFKLHSLSEHTVLKEDHHDKHQVHKKNYHDRHPASKEKHHDRHSTSKEDHHDIHTASKEKHHDRHPASKEKHHDRHSAFKEDHHDIHTASKKDHYYIHTASKEKHHDIHITSKEKHHDRHSSPKIKVLQRPAPLRRDPSHSFSHPKRNPPHLAGSSELVRIVHKTSGLCFTAESGIFPGGIRVLLHRCNNGENQKWNKKVTNQKHEFYLKESGDTKVIEVSGASDIIGAQIITSRSNGGDNQKWYFDQNKGILKNVKSGKCIDVPAGNAFPGVNLQQFDCNGTNSQNFKLHSEN